MRLAWIEMIHVLEIKIFSKLLTFSLNEKKIISMFLFLQMFLSFNIFNYDAGMRGTVGWIGKLPGDATLIYYLTDCFVRGSVP